jgi:hypothetical protein
MDGGVDAEPRGRLVFRLIPQMSSLTPFGTSEHGHEAPQKITGIIYEKSAVKFLEGKG